MARIASMVVVLASLVACVEDVGEGKSKAVIEAPAGAEAQVAAPVAGKSLPIDSAKSQVGALAAKVTAKHPITFPTFTGALTVDGDALTGVSFDVETASLFADVERLTTHLRAPDFFDVATFPTATFRSTGVVVGGEGGTHTVTGDLTIHGTTKRLSFPATVQASADSVTAKAEFVVDRRDFGMVYAGKADDLIQDNVVITVQAFASRG